MSTKESDLLDENSQVVETEEETDYSADTDSSVVVVEPMIVTIGRKNQRAALARKQLPSDV